MSQESREFVTESETNQEDSFWEGLDFAALGSLGYLEAPSIESITNNERGDELAPWSLVENDLTLLPFGAEVNSDSYRLPHNDTQGSTSGTHLGPLSAPVVLKPRPSRSSLGASERLKVKKVREAGSCIRCRMYNESCDEATPCARCTTVENTAKIFKQPCCREKLDDIIAFRAGNSRAGKLRSENSKFRWSSGTEIKVVNICYPFKDPLAQTTSTVSVKCRRFIPQEGDVLHDPQPTQSGQLMILHSDPYACCEADDTSDELGQYISAHKFSLLEESMGNVSDDIHKRTHKEALRYAKKYPDSAVSTALNIKAGSYFSRTNMVICGDNSLKPENFDDSPFYINGKCPVPPVLDYQIDFMAIQYMLKQMKLTVKRLKLLIFGKARNRDWFEVYLTIFVLLSSLEVVQARQVEVVAKWNAQTTSNTTRVRHLSTQMMHEWSYSAKVLIYHYRAILKGMVPFSLESGVRGREELAKTANLDDEALAYIMELKKTLKARGEELHHESVQDLDNPEGRAFAWLSQLYMDN